MEVASMALKPRGPSLAADLELPLQPLPELFGVQQQARIVGRGEDRHLHAVAREQGEKIDQQLVERDRLRDRSLPGAAGAGFGEGGVRPEGEGVGLLGHHPAGHVLEAPGLLPVGDELEEVDRAVLGGEREKLPALPVAHLPGHSAAPRAAPTGTASSASPAASGRGSGAAALSWAIPSSAFSSPRIQSSMVADSSGLSAMPALSQRLTTLRKKQAPRVSGSSGPFWPKRWPPKVMPRRMKLTLARAIGEPSSMHRSRTAFEVRVRK